MGYYCLHRSLQTQSETLLTNCPSPLNGRACSKLQQTQQSAVFPVCFPYCFCPTASEIESHFPCLCSANSCIPHACGCLAFPLQWPRLSMSTFARVVLRLLQSSVDGQEIETFLYHFCHAILKVLGQLMLRWQMCSAHELVRPRVKWLTVVPSPRPPPS